MMKIIAIPFGWILKLAYMLVKNYGVALFLFTVVINLIQLPSRIKQQKDSAKMARLKPKLDQIQKKYANNREKLNEATMELYNQENVNPMGSCLPLVITYVILFAIIEVVYAPMTYISNLPSEKINAAQQTVVDYYKVAQAVSKDKPEDAATAQTLSERLADGADLAELLTGYNESLEFSDERLAEVIAGFEANPGLDEYFNDNQKVSSRLLAGGGSRSQLIVLSVADDYPQLFDSEVVKFCEDFNYTFLGLYLGRYPSWKSVYVLIPIVSLLSQLLMMFLSQFFMKKNGQSVQQGKGMMTMLYVMPLISFWIAFSFPAGIGIYWIFSAIVQIFITVSLNLYFKPARMDKILAKDAKKTRRPSLYQMALEQQRAQNGGTAPTGSLLDDDDDTDRKLTKNERKELERQKINEARKRLVEDEEEVDPRVLEARKKMAEKYGDDY